VSPAGEFGLLTEPRGAHLDGMVIQIYVLSSVRPGLSALDPHASCAGCFLTSNCEVGSLDRFCRIMENLSLQATNVAHIDEFIAQVKVIFYFRFHSFS